MEGRPIVSDEKNPTLIALVHRIALHMVDLGRGVAALNMLPDLLRADRSQRTMALVDAFLDDPLGRNAIHLALAVDWRLDGLVALAALPDFLYWTLPTGRDRPYRPSIAVVDTLVDQPLSLVGRTTTFHPTAFLERLGPPHEAARRPIEDLGMDWDQGASEGVLAWRALSLGWLEGRRLTRAEFNAAERSLESLARWARRGAPATRDAKGAPGS